MDAHPPEHPHAFAQGLEEEIAASASFRNDATWIARRVRAWLAQDDVEGWHVAWDDQPSRYKTYPGLRRFALDAFAPLRFSGDLCAPVADYPIVPDRLICLGHLLALSAGVNSFPQVRSETSIEASQRFLRAVPSGGALYPWEIYVYWRERESLPQGLYHYDPAHHELALLAEGNFDRLVEESLGNGNEALTADVLLFASTVYWKSYFKYRDYCAHLQSLDIGVLVSQLSYLAPALGFQSNTLLNFRDEPLCNLLGISLDDEAVHAVVYLRHATSEAEDSTPTQVSKAATNTGSEPPVASYPPALERSREVLPAYMVRLLNRASVIHAEKMKHGAAPPSQWPGNVQEAIPLANRFKTATRPLGAVLRERRTGIAAFSSQQLEQGELRSLLSFASLDPPVDIGGPVGVSSCVSLFVAAHRVKGVDPGIYRYEPTLEALLPICRRPARALATELQQLYRLQNLCFLSAAAVVFVVGDYARALALYGNRGFRYLDHAAGWVVQRSTLAAGAADLGCHPIFGLRKRSAGVLLGIPADDCGLLVSVVIGSRPMGGATVSMPLWL